MAWVHAFDVIELGITIALFGIVYDSNIFDYAKKYLSDYLIHVHIWYVSLQIGSGNTRDMCMSFIATYFIADPGSNWRQRC